MAAEQYGIEVYIDPTRAKGGTKPVESALGGLEGAAKRTSDRVTAEVARMNRALSNLGKGIAGAGLAAGLNSASRAVAGLTAEFKRQADIMERIRGPARDYAANLRSLDQLFITGRINAEEYRRELQRIQNAATAAGVNIPRVTPDPKKPGLLARGVGAIGSLNPMQGTGMEALGGAEAVAKAAPVIAVAAAVAKLGDNYVQLQNKLRPLMADQRELDSTMEALYEQSQRLRISWEASVEGYSRVRRATKNLGLSQEDTLKFTERLGMAIQVSGATTQEASAGMVQLGQAMASGRLQGDELRSILENLPVVADVIAKGMGVTTGELRKLGSEGKISAKDIIDAFEKADSTLRTQFGSTTATLGQQWQRLKDALTRAVGALVDFLRETGLLKVAGLIWDGLVFVIDKVADVLGAVADAAGWVRDKISAAGSAIYDFFAGGESWNDYIKRIAGVKEVTEAAANESLVFAKAVEKTRDAVKEAVEVYKKLQDLGKTAEQKAQARIDALLQERKDHMVEILALEMAIQKAVAAEDADLVVRLQREIEALKVKHELKGIEAADTESAVDRARVQAEAEKKLTEAREEGIKVAREKAQAEKELGDWLERQLDYSKEMELMERARRRASIESNLGLSDADIYELEQAARVPGQAFAEMAEKAQAARDAVGGLHTRIKFNAGSQMAEWASMKKELEELRGVAIQAFQEMTNALTDFVMTGSFDIEKLTESILRMIAQFAIAKALYGGGFDSKGHALGGLLGELGFATGGSFIVGGHGGTDTTPVGFMATPGERVTIETPSQQRTSDAGGGGDVTLKNVNVTDPAASLDVMRSGAGERVTMNHIRTNAAAIKRMLR